MCLSCIVRRPYASSGKKKKRKHTTRYHQDTDNTETKKVRSWFNTDKTFERALKTCAEKVNGDAPEPVCPSLPALETMPTEAKLSEKLYEERQQTLLRAELPHRADKAWERSRTGNGAGSWANCIAMVDNLTCKGPVFKIMLHVYMGLLISTAEHIEECFHKDCKYEEDESRAFAKGRHHCTVCKYGRRTIIHDKVRDVVQEMYSSMGFGSKLSEQPGLLQNGGEERPADVWVPSSGSTTDKPMAIDIGITDPTSKTSLEAGSDRESLIAAKKFHERKMSLFEQQVRQSERPIDFDKVPLIFESTGAMGKETQKWWESVLKMERKRCEERRENPSRQYQGLEHTWSADRFASYWLQRISMAHARAQAETIELAICMSQPWIFPGRNA